MSVYGGFATRLLESKYNRLVEGLVCLLSYRVLAGMKGERIDETLWARDFIKIYRRMYHLEISKYLPPKLTFQCQHLSEYLLSSFHPVSPQARCSTPLLTNLSHLSDLPNYPKTRVMQSARRAEPSPPPASSRSPSPISDLIAFYIRSQPDTKSSKEGLRGGSAGCRRRKAREMRLRDLR